MRNANGIELPLSFFFPAARWNNMLELPQIIIHDEAKYSNYTMSRAESEKSFMNYENVGKTRSDGSLRQVLLNFLFLSFSSSIWKVKVKPLVGSRRCQSKYSDRRFYVIFCWVC